MKLFANASTRRSHGARSQSKLAGMPYRPLVQEANEVRLITILPVKDGDSNAQICCRLDTVSLSDAFKIPGRTSDSRRPAEPASLSQPPATACLPDFRFVWGDYLALSYVWGDPTVTKEILVNGVTLHVTENLHEAIRTLREKPYIQQGWKVWIDALCINQQDLVERGHEVKRMREIYVKSYTPIVWLGPAADGSETALQMIERIARDFCVLPDPVGQFAVTLVEKSNMFKSLDWTNLHDFMARRYWSRLWILQEAAQGPQNMPILCGPSTISWATLCAVFTLLLGHDEAIRHDMAAAMWLCHRKLDYATIRAHLEIVKDLRTLQTATLSGQTLPQSRILELGHRAFATDPRDKIYGLIGLLDADLASKIDSNYSMTVRDVFLDFVKISIDAGSLDVLYHVRRPRGGTEGFPSWLPDWSARQIGSPLVFHTPAFTTSGETTPEVGFSTGGSLLSCRGVLFDLIDGLGYVSDFDPIVQSKSRLNPYGSRYNVPDVVWRTFVCDRDEDLNPLSASFQCLLTVPELVNKAIFGEDFLALRNSRIWSDFVASCQENFKLIVCGHQFSTYFTSYSKSKQIDVPLLRSALTSQRRVFQGRRLLTTEKGYFGVGPAHMRRGDVVAVLLGASMPVILRKAGEHFIYVGECYIHGIMHGEVMAQVQSGQCQVEDVVLC